MTNNHSEKSFESFAWIDIKNPSKAQLETITEKFNLEIFPIKDSIEPGHLPKIEKIKDFSFVILRAYTANENDNISTVEELSNKVAFFYNEKQLITIHRTSFPFLETILLSDLKYHSVYELLIDLFKQIISTYSAPSQWQTDQIDQVENTLFLKKNNTISLEDLYFQKAEARISKKILVLTQNVIHQIKVPNENLSALEDVKDNLIKLILEYEETMENANNLMHTFLSVAAQKNNDVVKLLTVFSAFFLPLTFIAGVYGMNFDFMPELKWKFGYLYTIVFMLIVSVFIYIWFKKKNIV